MGVISQQQQSIALPMANDQNDGRSSELISSLQQSYPVNASPSSQHIHTSPPPAHSFLLPLQPEQCKTLPDVIEDSDLLMRGSVSLHEPPSPLTSLSSLTSPFEHNTEVSAQNISPMLSSLEDTPTIESPCTPPNVQTMLNITQAEVQPAQSLPLRRSERVQSQHTSSQLDLHPTPLTVDILNPVRNINCLPLSFSNASHS